jgi:hypothetical protein
MLLDRYGLYALLIVTPNAMIAEQPSNNSAKIWTAAGIIISWATFWMFLFSPFGLLAWCGILIYLIVKKSKLKFYFIFSAWLAVPSCSFLTGTVRYATGTASLQGVGGPQTFHGVDRETRVNSTSSGCMVVGYEPFVFPANNAAIRLWTNLFGFQKGAYAGVFPTEVEAKEIIKSSDTIVVKRIGQYYEFMSSNQTARVDTSEFYRYRYLGVSIDTVVGKMINNECFIFQQIDSNDNEKGIYLVNIEKHNLLKQYFEY